MRLRLYMIGKHPVKVKARPFPGIIPRSGFKAITRWIKVGNKPEVDMGLDGYIFHEWRDQGRYTRRESKRAIVFAARWWGISVREAKAAFYQKTIW